MDTLKIYYFIFINFLLKPFFYLRIRFLGIEPITNELCTVFQKASDQGSFEFTANDFYIKHYVHNGFFVYDKKDHSIFFSLTKSNNPAKDIHINKVNVNKIKIFKYLIRMLKSHNIDVIDRWSASYKNKKITNIVCKLQIQSSTLLTNSLLDIICIELMFTFDANLTLMSFEKKYIYYDSYKRFFINHVDNPVLLDEEVLFLVLAIQKKGSPIAEMFPEYYIPSAYDFQSVEFQQRIELFHMMNY